MVAQRHICTSKGVFARGLLLLGLLTLGGAVQACGPYRVAFYEFGLLYYRDLQGVARGIDLDVVDAVRERSGCRLDTWVDSRVRIWNQLAEGHLDVTVSGIPTAEREFHSEFMPYIYTRNMLVLRRGLPRELKTPSGFLGAHDRRIAVVKGFKHGHFFDEWLDKLRTQGGRTVEAADFEAVVRLFKAGRVDAFLALPTSWILAARRHDIESLAELQDWAPQDRVIGSLVVSRHTVPEADRRRLRSAVLSLLADGSIDAILRRHVGPDLAATMRYLPPSADR
ncbi:substrate-binding periplasmic protein [Inhella gelatinilytica]|uniref:Transporter substrate-binding domain-containing protein n=1 Tax=Inhella gelatinilytica TaxID=2795030 RepID=A0A931IX61_9BURK|nr:transporter substrate-binding domain-containing protein [Inhella gelatinilytica]MBH9553794.1 transporter substrate-binding domain-containing protein [Inhella gelatinilytica]